jgi:glycosyltransferase involved in cell wall biosynthesis
LKRISVIGTVGLPASYGGWETLVDNITTKLRGEFEFVVYCSSKEYEYKKKEHNGAKLVYIPLKANGAQSIAYDIFSMIHAIFSGNIFLILGVSGCIFLPFLKLLSRNTIITNIDGIEWKRGKWGRFAKWFLKLSERFAVKCSDIVITDNKAIYDYVKAEYNVESVVIAYGGDQAKNIILTKEIIESKSSLYPFLKGEYSFKVCRIEPENNLDIILEAFSKCPETPLVIIGNWNNSLYGKKLKQSYQGYQHIYLLDPIYDKNELDTIRSNAKLYVHGHSVGGTNPSLVEAMSLGLPIAAYDVSYNRESTHNEAVFFKNSDELVDLVNNVSDNLLIQLGKDMRSLAEDNYTWKEISSKYASVFNS